MKTLIIDNYDSFTYNIYQLVAQINSETPIVITNNQLSWTQIKQGNFDNIIISPGPGNPQEKENFGVCGEVLLNSQIPILGICLGHQGLGYYYGCEVVKAPEPLHGRLSDIYHKGNSLFTSIPSPFKVVRYHSLMLTKPLSSEIEVIGTTEDKLIMAIKHKLKPFWGVQFHPESIASEYGKRLLLNFNGLTRQYYRSNSILLPYYQKQLFSNRLKQKVHVLSEDKTDKIKPKKKLKIYSKKIDTFRDSAQVFEKFYGSSTNSFWLDSSMVAKGLSRFSYMGDCDGKNSFLVMYQLDTQQITIIRNNQKEYYIGDIFDFLQEKLDQYIYESDNLPFNFNGGFVGYLGYELKSLCGSQNKHKYISADAQFIFVDKMIVFDHQEEDIYLIYVGRKEQEILAIKWFIDTENKLDELNITNHKKLLNNQTNNYNNYNLSRKINTYLTDIDTCFEKIREGESYEICLTNHLYLEKIQDPLKFYYQLRKINSAPYSAFFKLNKVSIACSSPERFLHLEKNGYIESKPIKGTVKRGNNQKEDEQLKNKLQCSEKEQAENLMIVDLLRNDLGKICEIGSVSVPKLMAIESYSTVHQMVSTVRGKIKPGIKTVDFIKACFPGGSMTGAPKKRTMEIIDELETEARGIYSGSIGFLALNGTMDLNIVIRTAIVTPEKTSIGVGGAITILSHPDSEFAETILKAKALIEIINKQ